MDIPYCGHPGIRPILSTQPRSVSNLRLPERRPRVVLVVQGYSEGESKETPAVFADYMTETGVADGLVGHEDA